VTAAALTPGSPEWRRVVTASKVAAILGVSPYESPRSLWHLMRGDVVPPTDPTAVQSRGHYLEPAILAWWADRHPELRIVSTQYEARRADLPWAAATPDAMASDLHLVNGGPHPDATEWSIVEAKSSDKDDEWGTPGTDEIPAYYAAQVIWAMHLAGARRAYVPIITSHLEFREYVVEYHADLAADIEARCAAFYASLAAAVPPPLDDHVATYESLRRIHPEIDGSDIEIDRALAQRYIDAQRAARDAEAERTAAMSALLDAMGNARRAVCDGRRIAYRKPGRDGRAPFLSIVSELLKQPDLIERTAA
jgi:putative phage-type endonuclease